MFLFKRIPTSQRVIANRVLFSQDSGFLDGAFECQNSALISLSRLLYDEVIKSILRIVEKLDLSVQKVTTGEEVSPQWRYISVHVLNATITPGMGNPMAREYQNRLSFCIVRFR